MKPIRELKEKYYRRLDSRALRLARLFSKPKSASTSSATSMLLALIGDLYQAARAEAGLFEEDGKYSSAYHQPVTSDLEFLTGRLLYHYSEINHLKWEIFVRRQRQSKKKVNGAYRLLTPDIRVERDGRTVAIIEIKAKVGWNQSFYSRDRFMYDRDRNQSNQSLFDPRVQNALTAKQFQKYYKGYGISKDRFFVLVPSIAAAYRKKYGKQIEAYELDFCKNAKLNPASFILLSRNPTLDLDAPVTVTRKKDFVPTDKFEKLLKKLVVLEIVLARVLTTSGPVRQIRHFVAL